MRQLQIVSILYLSLAIATSANAAPSPNEILGASNNNVVICDTKEQLLSIVSAGSWDTAKAQYDKYNQIINGSGKPSCVMSKTIVAMVINVIDAGGFISRNVKFRAYVLEVAPLGQPKPYPFYLYLEEE